MTSYNSTDYFRLLLDTLSGASMSYLDEASRDWRTNPADYTSNWIKRVMGGSNQMSDQLRRMTGATETLGEKMRKSGLNTSGDYSGQYGQYGKLRGGYDVFAGGR